MEKIAVDLPYPSLDNIEENYKDAMIIAPAYSGLHSETTATFQYIYHHFYFNEYNDDVTAKILLSIALNEMEHFEILGKTLLKLGVDPVVTLNPPYRYNPYNTSGVMYAKEKQKMLLQDISGELIAINEYEKMLDKIKDERVSAVISRILLDEQLHVRVLKEQLERECGR